MKQALELAREAALDGEVPVGCVIACGGVVVGRGRNRREKTRSALSHAEIEAIDQACRSLGAWRLNRCSMYVTLEPCPMCAGAILNARIKRLYFGARDGAMGSCGSVINLFEESYGFHPEIYGGIMAEECAGLLKDFFEGLRKK